MLFILECSPRKLQCFHILLFLLNYKEFSFFIKTQKGNHPLASHYWEYIKFSFKEMLGHFLNNSSTNRISRLKKRLRNLYKNQIFKPEIKPMIRNLWDELYQLENKQANILNVVLISDGKKCSKFFFKVPEERNIQDQILSELYIDYNKSKHSSNLVTFSSLPKISIKNFVPMRQLPKLLLLNFLAKFLIERKYQKTNFTFERVKYL